MEESLDSLYARLSLADDEKASINGNSAHCDSLDKSHSLVGRILAPRIISFEHISSLFKKLWNPKGSLSCKPLHDNTVLFSFGDPVDKKKVQLGAPWLLDNYLMPLEEAKSDMVISNFEFKKSPFWIQLHNIPLGLMTTQFASIAGNSIGQFIDVDCDASGSAIGKFLRIRVEMDISKPLRRILQVDYQSHKITVVLKYERLPDFCFFCGKIDYIIDKIKNDLGFHGFAVDPIGRSGGLALLWRKNLQVSLRVFSHHFIDADFLFMNSSIRIMGVYGEPNVSLRRRFWSQFNRIYFSPHLPWLCFGDFNEVLAQSEFQGTGLRAEWQIQAFREAISQCSLMDMGFKGDPFTWHRLSVHSYTQRARLDRCFHNGHFENIFPRKLVSHIPTISSDHQALLIQAHDLSTPTHFPGRKKPFRFEACWVKRKECEEVIKTHWNSSLESAQDMILNCSIGLLNWSKSSVGNIVEKIKDVKAQIFSLRKKNITAESNVQLHELTALHDHLLEQENLIWKQRAKQHWYKEGDRNSTFFHSFASQRRETNHISALKNSQGQLLSDNASIERIITDYFNNIFSSTTSFPTDLQEALRRVKPRVTATMNNHLTLPFKDDEVVKALKEMHPFKSPGPDANRLRIFLPSIISESQSAFIPGRLISDNILIAYETHHYMKTRTTGTSSLMSIKLDMSKAFDRDLQLCNKTQGISISKGPGISHLFFADDTLLFLRATIDEARHLKFAIQLYERVSGQQVNFEKSGVLFSPNTEQHLMDANLSILGMKWVVSHGKYLGLPSVIGKSKKEAIPTFAMSCFKIPDYILDDIQSLAASYWWGSSEDKKKLHWHSWDKLSVSKNRGGIGFRNLRAFNMAMLSKQAWRILTNPSSLLSRVFKSKYFPNCNFLQASIGSRPSWSWRSILESRKLINLGAKKLIRSGSSTNIWSDPWLPQAAGFYIRSKPNRIPQNSNVSMLIDAPTSSWKDELIHTIFPPWRLMRFCLSDSRSILRTIFGAGTLPKMGNTRSARPITHILNRHYPLARILTRSPGSGLTLHGKTFGTSTFPRALNIFYGAAAKPRSPLQKTWRAMESPPPSPATADLLGR
ncbi:hypothetical protein DH2020_042911 [Rehmannia glutinosa]|uniref:Reverse transcriptase domain-containing protein n=1 Tax=Rehmannia glutinosa TaxID=99300 RepID=A0ABR0ULL9_REHGL